MKHGLKFVASDKLLNRNELRARLHVHDDANTDTGRAITLHRQMALRT